MMLLKQTARWGLGGLIGALKGSPHVVVTPPFLRRQVVFSKRARQLRTFHTRDGIDTAVLYQVFLDEHYRLDKLARASCIEKRYRSILESKRRPLIVDCGANIGLSSAYFCEAFPEARVVGIEPESGNVAQARRNCPEAEFIEAAISSENGHGAVVDPGHGNWGFRVERDASGVVPFLAMNQVLATYSDSEPFIAKVDIEGFESDLFSKNTEWMDRFFLLIVELHDWMLPKQGTSASFLKAIAGRDRDFVHIGENIFSIAN
jgi:FkbM family methyltransferase